jgi:hypothetical protein
MHSSHVVGAVIAIAVGGWLVSAVREPVAVTATPVAAPPIANGHYVLVVEGDRDALVITRAVAKADPWAGAPKGLLSRWRLTIHDGNGELLADVPLDLSKFELAPEARGTTRVEGCLVKSGNIGMLVNVPAFASAATYTITRPGDAGGAVVVGTATGANVRDLAGGGR